MNPFTADELRTMSEGVHAMYSAANDNTLCECTFNLLRQIIPNEIALFDERSFRTGGWTVQFARLLQDELNAGESVLPFSPRGRFILDLARPHFARARQLLERATNPALPSSASPASSSSARPTKPIDLTPREREVLYWVSEGKTNGQIGLILNASSRTIQKHLEHIFQKLGVETRTSATVRAIETGILATISLAIA